MLNDETNGNAESEEAENYPDHLEETGAPSDTFIMRHVMTVMVSDGAKKHTSTKVTEKIVSTLKENVADIILMGYSSANEGTKA